MQNFSFIFRKLFAKMSRGNNAKTMQNFAKKQNARILRKYFRKKNSAETHLSFCPSRTLNKIQLAMSQPITRKNLLNGAYFQRNFRVFLHNFCFFAFFREICAFPIFQENFAIRKKTKIFAFFASGRNAKKCLIFGENKIFLFCQKPQSNYMKFKILEKSIL